MKVFVAGGSGVIGLRLLPRLLAAGHTVAATTRTPSKLQQLRDLGVTLVLCDIFDVSSLIDAVEDFQPDLLMHQVTDLPDDIAEIAKYGLANNRVRSEGTHNLIAAAARLPACKLIAQSIAWPGGAVVEAHDRAVSEAGGTVLKYGQFYGPGTYYQTTKPPHPRVQVDAAAERTMAFLDTAPTRAFIVEAE